MQKVEKMYYPNMNVSTQRDHLHDKPHLPSGNVNASKDSMVKTYSTLFMVIKDMTPNC